MSLGRLARLVGIGLVATVVIVVVIVGVTSLFPSPSGKQSTPSPWAPGVVVDPNVDIAVVVDDPGQYWAAVYVAKPLTPDEYRKLAKSIGDRELQNRNGQVQVFDDKWARDMVLTESQHIELTDEQMKRWDKHQVMTYVHSAKGFWFDR
jgi:hypothetical protein